MSISTNSLQSNAMHQPPRNQADTECLTLADYRERQPRVSRWTLRADIVPVFQPAAGGRHGCYSLNSLHRRRHHDRSSGLDKVPVAEHSGATSYIDEPSLLQPMTALSRYLLQSLLPASPVIRALIFMAPDETSCPLSLPAVTTVAFPTTT